MKHKVKHLHFIADNARKAFDRTRGGYACLRKRPPMPMSTYET